MTNKHAVSHVVPNLNLLFENNDAHSEPVKETQHILVLSRPYVHKTITVNFQDPKMRFEKM